MVIPLAGRTGLPGWRRRVAAVILTLGLAMTMAGLALVTKFALEARRSDRVQSGTKAAAIVVRTAEVENRRQRVTLRYEDDTGRDHLLKARLPLGIAEEVEPGLETAVVYDAGSPERAELPGEPRRSWAEVAVAGGATAVATSLWLTVLLGLSTPAGAAGPAEDTGRPKSDAGWEPPHRAPRRVAVPTVAVVALLLLVGGRVALQFGIENRPQVVPFPATPPPLDEGGQPVALPPVLSAPPPPGSLVTPDTAKQVFEATWRLRDEALVRRDVATVRAIETGPALEVDLARMLYGTGTNRTGSDVGRLDAFNVYVPAQTTWPVRFMAQAVTTSAGEPFLEVMVFVREGPTSSWLLTLDTGMSADDDYQPHPQPQNVDPDRYNVVPPSEWIQPQDVAPALSSYWQAWIKHGRPPVEGIPFATGHWTTEYGKTIADLEGKPDSNGLLGSLHPADPPPASQIWVFGVSGKQLACFPLRDRVTWKGPAHQDGERRKWGPHLPPGTYRTVTSERVRQTCAVIPPRSGAVAVFGADPGIVDTRGERQRSS